MNYIFYRLFAFVICFLQAGAVFSKTINYNPNDSLQQHIREARTLVDQGKAEEAEILIDSLIMAYQQAKRKEPQDLVELYGTINIIKQHQGEFQEAFDYLEQGILLAEKHGLSAQLVTLYFSKAKIYSNTSQFNEAMELYLSSARLVEQQGDSLRLEQVYNNIANVLLRAREFDKAIAYYRKAGKMSEHRQDDRANGINALNLAVGYIRKGEKDTVLPLFERSLMYFNRLGDQKMLGVAYQNYGQFLFDEGNLIEAEAIFNKTLELRRQMDSDIDRASTMSGLGKLYLTTGRVEEAEQVLLEAEKLLHSKENTSQLRKVYSNLRDVYEAEKDFQKAFEYQSRLFEAEKILHDENKRVDLLNAASAYELEKRALQFDLERRSHRNRQMLITFVSLFVILILSVWFIRFRKRQRLQAELRYRLKELEAEQQILFSAQNERKRISRDLHDDLGTTISAIKLLVTNSYAKDKGLLKMVEKANQDVRDFFTRIASADLEDRQLTKTINFTIENLRATEQITYQFLCSGDESLIPKNLIQPLSRIAVELLLNVAKHSQATECMTQLFIEEREVQLMVEDNGKGFNMEKRPTGMGIDNIHIRAKQWAGRVHYSTGKGGTTVIVTVPFQKTFRI